MSILRRSPRTRGEIGSYWFVKSSDFHDFSFRFNQVVERVQKAGEVPEVHYQATPLTAGGVLFSAAVFGRKR
jgi:hypothetical protein